MLKLDRIAIEDVGANPQKLAEAILKQMPGHIGAVPVYDIAYALDIKDIQEKRVTSFEGCLLTDYNKSDADILLNLNSNPRRRRYTLGHELGHFLNCWHEPTEEAGFICTAVDMRSPKRKGQHQKQEREANEFAIELLAPRDLIKARLARAADLEHAIGISGDMDISPEAAVRRYVSLQAECLAAVFSRNDQVRYIEKSKEFPGTTVWIGDQMPNKSRRSAASTDLSTLDEVDAGIWLSNSRGRSLFQQTLLQENGYAITLLLAE